MSILDIVFPKLCVGCGREGQYICDICQGKLVRPSPICPMCCRPALDGWTHPRCLRSAGMERLVVGLPYKCMVQKCLKKVKYKSAWEILGFLVQMWRESCEVILPDECVIVGIPMWSEKESMRGFNQAEMIARLISTTLPAHAGQKIELLRRVRETRPMYGLKKGERAENIEGAFEINPKAQILEFSNQRVILVDDVWTTGATMREAAKVLKENGAKEIWGVAIAR